LENKVARGMYLKGKKRFLSSQAGADLGFLEEGANSRYQSLGWRCAPACEACWKRGVWGHAPPRKIFKNRC